jgi:hypothetical protein
VPRSDSSESKKPYLLVELSGGSDGARTLMYDTIVSSTSSKRSTIHCSRIVSANGTIRGDVIARLSREFLRISGRKSLYVMLVVRVYGSWRSGMAFHMRLFGRF